jgi:hypothetical protein
MIAFEVLYRNILQNDVCAFFMFQAEAVRIAVLQFGLLRAIVCIFELVYHLEHAEI